MGNIFRDLFGWLDRGIYDFMVSVYQLLMQLANLEIFDQKTIGEFSTRIYAIIGILMGFKLIFTFINYVVNPDSLTDSKVGGKKLVINIITSLVLLIAVPTVIFPLSREIQNQILKSQLLEKVILGIDGDALASVGTQGAANNVRSARMTAYFVFSSFFYPSVCESNEFYLDKEAPDDWQSQDQDKEYKYKLNGDCAQKIVDEAKSDGYKALLAYEKAYNQFSVRWLTGKVDGVELKTVKTKDGEYLFDYSILISTIVGIAVTWILFTFCFEITVRSIKLGLLELIAPVPILSYIDAKTKKTFDNWVKACVSAYMQLFIRLIGVYFAVFVISNIGLGKVRYTSESGITTPVGAVVNLFVIIGALMFAQQLPKLIDEIFGTKLGSAKFSLNPLKNSPLANAVVGGAVGAIGAGAISAGGNIWANSRERKDLKEKLASGTLKEEDLDKRQQRLVNNRGKFGLATVGSAIGGFGSGGARGIYGGLKGKGSSSYGKIISNAAQNTGTARNLRRDSDYGMKERAFDKLTDLTKVNYKTGTASALKDKVKNYQRAVADARQAEERIKQSQAANMQSILSRPNNKIRTGEFEKINGKINTETLEQEVKFGNFKVNWEEALKRENAYMDTIYSEYEKDAQVRGLGSNEYMDRKTFDDAFGLVVDYYEANETTRQLEKGLKSAQENEEARKKKN